MTPERAERIFTRACCITFVVVGLLNLIKFWTFHTGLYDLGIFHQVLWNTSQGRPFESSIKHMNYLGDHFSPALALLAPIEWLPFPVELLLLIQAGACVSMAFSMRALASRHIDDPQTVLLLSLGMLWHPAVIGPLFFDFHPEVLMAAALCRALLHIDAGRQLRSVPWLLLVLLGKEDAGLLLLSLGLVLCLFPKTRRLGIGLFLCSLVYTAVVMRLIMPRFRPPAPPGSWFYLNRYTHLGTTPAEILRTVLLHPLSAIVRSFTVGKLLTAIALVFAFAGASLFGGRKLLAALPVFGAHYLSQRWQQFNFWFQYLALTVPILGWAAVAGAKKGRLPRPRIAAALILVSTGVAFLTRLWLPWYVPGKQFAALREVVRLVPKDASVCVPNDGVGAQLAARQQIDLCVFMDMEQVQYKYFGWSPYSDAEYQIFDLNDYRYESMVPERVRELRGQGAQVLYERDGVILFRRSPRS